MEELITKAATLIEALPYLQKFSGKIFLFKYGGSAMNTPELRRNFLRDLVLLKQVGIHPVVVHGGGPQIKQTLDKMNIKTEFVNGLRVTDDETMKVVEMVLVGQVNSEIVNLINNLEGNAISLSGKDGGMMKAKKLPLQKVKDEAGNKQEVDLGHVGEVTKIETTMIKKLILEDGFIPVIAPIAVSDAGESLNINADVAASEMSTALKAEKLVLLTDVKGIHDENDEVISRIDHDRVQKLLKDGVIKGGMIPKVESSLKALEGGVNSVAIVDGQTKHAVLLEIFTDKGVGTLIN